MSFNIEEYLNSLPRKITIINVANKGITYLPDLSRFTQLKELDCSNNQLTSLPKLNNSLLRLYCSNNKLTSLPKFNKKLQELSCDNNQLINYNSFTE